VKASKLNSSILGFCIATQVTIVSYVRRSRIKSTDRKRLQNEVIRLFLAAVFEWTAMGLLVLGVKIYSASRC